VLPARAQGQHILSLAFSHLRRPGPPALQARADGVDLLFNGVAPWMTGWGVADEVLLAGTLADGRSVWVIAPLTSSAALAASPPMALCAMNASATVSLTCRDLRIGPERHVKTLAPEELAADTAGAILFFAALSLGVTRSAIDLVRDEGERRNNAAALRAVAALEAELTAARAAVNRCGADLTETARVRAHCIDLGVRAAHAAVAAGSGAANSLEHAAQRVFREAMVYTLIAQTRDLQTATFERLVGS
jgi:alkylation response protein AidB-like acyl-CoA dehydrogenase